MKVKHLKALVISSGSSRIDKTLFRRMLSTWTELEIFRIYSLPEVGQLQLNQIMPGYWPNLLCLTFSEKPEDLKFVTEFKNLRKLTFRSNLPRKETMFLMRASPSLYHICFHNQSTDFSTCLNTRKRAKYWKTPKVFPRYSHIARNKYLINHYRQEGSTSYLRIFNSLEQMVDHYYDHDLFNKQKVSSFKAVKDLFKIVL